MKRKTNKYTHDDDDDDDDEFDNNERKQFLLPRKWN